MRVLRLSCWGPLETEPDSSISSEIMTNVQDTLLPDKNRGGCRPLDGIPQARQADDEKKAGTANRYAVPSYPAENRF